MSRYTLGTVVIRSSGYTFVNTRRGQIAEHRLIMENVLGRELEPGEKVIHLDNTLRGVDPKAFNDRKNLNVVKCRTTKWKPVRCRVLFSPTEKKFPKYRELASK